MDRNVLLVIRTFNATFAAVIFGVAVVDDVGVLLAGSGGLCLFSVLFYAVLGER